MKKIVYLDMDDTISILLEPWVERLNKTHNLNVKVEDIKEWDVAKAFPTLTKKEVYEDVLADEEFWKNNIIPVEGAVEYIQKLQEKFDVYVVTATYYKNIFAKMEYVLKKYFYFIPENNIIFLHNKQLLNGFVMVDDFDRYLDGGNYHKILINKPYNKKAKGDYIRVDNWEEIWYNINMLDELERSNFL